MAAYQFLAQKRLVRESHRQVSVALLANCGDGKEITKQLDAWENE